MAKAPGIGPKMTLEQELALEATRRLAMTLPREHLATMIRQLHHDNMLLRQAIAEIICGED
jgi:hypothetical protein